MSSKETKEVSARQMGKENKSVYKNTRGDEVLVRS